MYKLSADLIVLDIHDIMDMMRIVQDSITCIENALVARVDGLSVRQVLQEMRDLESRRLSFLNKVKHAEIEGQNK